jgi:hypothetical protein
MPVIWGCGKPKNFYAEIWTAIIALIAQSIFLFWRTGILHVLDVVPAKAGTYTLRQVYESRCSTAFAQHLPPVVMGPCVRRDDLRGCASPRIPAPLHPSSLSGRSGPQRGRMPAQGKAFDLPAHDFQVFDFQGTALALPQVLLADERIGRVQLSVEKGMEDEFPFPADPSRTSAVPGRLRRGHVHEVAEREHHLAPLADAGLAESLLRFDQLHLKPPLRGSKNPSKQRLCFGIIWPLTIDSRACDNIPKRAKNLS